MAVERSIMDNDFGSDIDVSRIKPHKLEAMRKLFPGQDHRTLARFLLARNGKKDQVNLSAELLRKHIAWERVNYPVLKSSCLTEFNKGKFYVRGVDKEGHPIIHVNIGLLDPNDRDADELGRAVVFAFYSLMKELPPDKTKVTILSNRVGANKAPDYDFASKIMPVIQNHFPERAFRVIVYPATLLYWGIWNITKYMVDQVTREKVKPIMYEIGVKDFVDDKWIPRAMGGTDDYVFNGDDYSDPYPENVIIAANERNGNASFPSIFEDPPVADDIGAGAINEEEICAAPDAASKAEVPSGPRVIKGSLMKKSPRSLVGWQSRFCKLDKHGVFSYYSCEADTIGQPKGCFSLSDVVVEKRELSDMLGGSCVSIQVEGRLYEFEADNSAIAADWVDAIQSHFAHFQ